MNVGIKQWFYAIAVCLMFSCAPVWAATTYQYSGNNYDTLGESAQIPGSWSTSMSVSGDFSVNTPLGTMIRTDISSLVVEYSFDNGRDIFTNLNSSIAQFQVAIDSSGEISEWIIELTQGSFSAVNDVLKKVGTQSWLSGQQIDDDRGAIFLCTAEFNGLCNGPAESAVIMDSSGTWSVVPVPAAVWFFGSALGLLGWMRRKRA